MTAGHEFRKYEGLGNDFIVVDAHEASELPVDRVPALCDRRRGVGADGVLLVLPARAAGCDVRMRVVNADGSVPEMCGNGARCVALHVARRRGLSRGAIRIDTDAGTRACDVDDSPGAMGPDGAALVTVEMGAVRVLGERTLSVGGERVQVTIADAGNPHAVALGDFAPGDIERLGPRIAACAEFPWGTNVEFARVAATGIDVVVWERGVGFTLACGTGACAAAAVVRARGALPGLSPIVVNLPGGRLDVVLDPEGRATLRGPARHVFSGTLPPG